MRRHHGRRGLGDLPRDHSRTGPLNDPGAGLIPDWVNNYKASNFPFVTGLISQQVIPANPLRCYVLVQNKNALNDMFINFGADATPFNGVIIIPRGNYEFVGGSNNGAFSPSDSINILGAIAGMNGVVVEGVLPPVIPGG